MQEEEKGVKFIGKGIGIGTQEGEVLPWICDFISKKLLLSLHFYFVYSLLF